MIVAIADDHGLVREGFASLVQQMDEVSDVVDASSVDELEGVLQRHPDIALALLDLDMPGMDGVASLERLQDRYPTIPFAVISAAESAPVARRLLDAGASGYIPKSTNNEGLVSAIRLMFSGNVFVPPFVLQQPGNEAAHAVDLTERQLEVLALMAEGQSNKEIARALDISESTVKKHATAVLEAFGVDNRAKVVREALHRGLVEAC